jgi:hypothetical protein
MKPFIIIKGSDQNLEDFEDNIADAIEQGYEVSSDLITHTTNNKLTLLQPMVLESTDDEEGEEENIN